MSRIRFFVLILFITLTSASLALSQVLCNTADADPYFDNVFDGVWAGYLELEGIEMPLLVNFNSQGAASYGYVFFYGGGEEWEELEFIPFPISGVNVKKKKVSFEFDAFEWRKDEWDYEAKLFDLTLKYNKKKGCLSGKFAVDDPESGETIKGSVLLYRMDHSKPVQGLWFGEFPDVVQTEVPLSLFLTQNSPVDGKLLLYADKTPFKNGQFSNNVLTGDIEVQSEAGLTFNFDLWFKYSPYKLDGNASYQTKFKKKIGFDLKLLPAGTNGKAVKLNNVKPKSTTAGSELQITVTGSNFADGAIIHVDNGRVIVSDVEFISSSKLRAVLSMPNKITKGTKIGIRVVNPDNQHVEKSGAITIK